jgi:GNAT superfamily N-acetyltransferase
MSAARSSVGSIRDAVAADAATAGDLFAQLGYETEVDDLARRITALNADPQARFLVAVEGERVLGAATIYFVPVVHQDGAWCRITALVVDARLRRSGVGRALVAACEEAAAAAGCLRVEATSATRRHDAHQFYERLGYTREAHHFLKNLRV